MSRVTTGQAAVACFVLIAALTLPVVPAHARTGGQVGLLSGPLPDAEDVLISIDLAANGSAHWQVQYRYQLEDDNETEAFDAFRGDVEANRSAYRRQFRRTMSQSAQIAENQTGRPMSLSSTTVTTRRQPVPQETGVVIYEIVWHGFGRANSSHLRAGSVLSGFYLDPTTELTMAWPTTYRASDVTPRPETQESNRVAWTGERTFGPDEPHVLVTRPQASSQTDTRQSQSTTARTASSNDGKLSAPLLVAVLSIAVFGGGLVAARHRGAFTDDASDDASATGEPPKSLLSNEERVLALLEDRGGRMKQQAIADELDWRASKTSKVVSSLQEDDEVAVFRLGRENVLTLPDVSIDGSREDEEYEE
jgi:uncharacterized membrane protein